MSIKKTLEDFDEKFDLGEYFTASWGDKYEYKTDQLKQFITSEIENALKEVVPEELELPPEEEQKFVILSQEDIEYIKDLEERIGFNSCRKELLSNISKYINN